MPNRPIAFATHQGLPNLAPDDRLALEALADAGLDVRPAIWNSPQIKWGEFSAVVIRSCWDYHLMPQKFKAWLNRLEALDLRVWNPPEIVRWNMDKFYLKELQEKGVRVTPSVWLRRGEPAKLGELLRERGWQEAVLKPTVSASAHQTLRLRQNEAASFEKQFSEMLGSNHMLVQPFMEEIRTKGEWSLLFFGKQFSHAVLKRPAEGDFRVQQQFGGSEQAQHPPDHLIEQAHAILDLIDAPLLYARVDGVESDGDFVLMELELIEPVLFFRHSPDAALRFSKGLLERL